MENLRVENKGITMRDRGYGIVIDSIFALSITLIFFTALMGIRYTGSTPSEMSFKRLHYVSEDLMDVLNKKGVLDQIGENWAMADGSRGSDEFIMAANISNHYIGELLPGNIGYMLTVEGEEVANDTRGVDPDRAMVKTHATRLLVGYGRGLPTRGHVARAFLTNIKEKETSRYAYFGGYVGQGNLTVYIRDLPVDAHVNRACFELNVPVQFRAHVNDNYVGTFTPSGSGMEATVKGSAGCINGSELGYFASGDNKIDVMFNSSNISLMYVGGGYLRVAFNTSQMDTDQVTKVERYYFPGIKGIINLYDSFYVPGQLDSLEARLHYMSNHSTYLNIGGITVYNSTGNETEQNITITNAELQAAGLIYQPTMSGRTVPLRMGTGNFTQVIETGNADVVLITDVSGSMMWRIGYTDSTNGVVRNCSDANLYGNNTRRISLAKCLNIDFINTVMNHTGNRIALVTFDTVSEADGGSPHHLTDAQDNNSLIQHVMAYSNTPAGGTCVCCAINRAYQILESETLPGRDRYVIVMTDGITGYNCGGCGYTSGNCSSCSGSCNRTSGLYSCDGNPGDCNNNACLPAVYDAICAARRAYANLSAQVRSIAFSPSAVGCNNADLTLQGAAACGNGTYCAGGNATAAAQCYVNVSSDIFTSSTKSQTVYFGGTLLNSTLYPDSYLKYGYTPGNESTYGEVSITQSSDPFNDVVDCHGHISIPPNVVVADFKVTSYSSEHWTDYLRVQNSQQDWEVFKLWDDFGPEYAPLGDPYIVNVRPDYVVSGEVNTVTVGTGDNQTSRTGCSVDDRAVYTLRIQSLVGYGDIHPTSLGCRWTVEFEDGSSYTTDIPAYYNETEDCYYTSTNISYDETDAIDDAVYRLFSNIDLDKDGRVDLLFDPSMIDFELSSAGGVQSLWGPAKFKLILWI